MCTFDRVTSIIHLSKRARSDLQKVPKHIYRKLDGWISAVENEGLEVVRKVRGYHDEPLKGQRAGQRSIRLSLSYRAIYTVAEESQVRLVRIEEVSKHEY